MQVVALVLAAWLLLSVLLAAGWVAVRHWARTRRPAGYSPLTWGDAELGEPAGSPRVGEAPRPPTG